MHKMVIFLLLVSSSLFSQSTYLVSKDGSGNFKSISEVNSANLQPGDIVSFKSGQKFADAVLKCKKGVTYNTYGGTKKAVIGDSSGTISSDYTIHIVSDNVTITDLKVYSYKNSKGAIIFSSGNWIISFCDIIGGENATKDWSEGIKNGGFTTTPIVITHNKIHHFSRGIYISNPFNLEISYNEIYDIWKYPAHANIGGVAFFSRSTKKGKAFDCKYSVHIHHNDFHDFEHSAMYIGKLSNVLVEQNYFHDNLDERLYQGGISHGAFGKLAEQEVNSLGNIIRYNYFYNLKKYGEPSKSYYRPTYDQLLKGTIQEGSKTELNYPYYINGHYDGSGKPFVGEPHGNLFGGGGASNNWIHNNVFVNIDHRIYSKTTQGGGYSKHQVNHRSFLINNTIYNSGNSFATSGQGLININSNSGSPFTIVNNIFHYVQDNWSSTLAVYQDNGTVDHNIYINESGIMKSVNTEKENHNYPFAQWWQFNRKNEVKGDHEMFLTDPSWSNTSAYIYAFSVGVNSETDVYIPDLRLSKDSKALNAGIKYESIGDSYNGYGQDPTGRSFAYDILGQLRTSNDIGALGMADLNYNDETDDKINEESKFVVYLEGNFNGDAMQPIFENMNSFPTFQPYNIAPWSLVDNSTYNSDIYDIVDWIIIELRTNESKTDYAKPALLSTDGRVLNSDRNSFRFNNILEGKYFICVRHRNHLDIMSSQPIEVNNGQPINYNFSTDKSTAYGTDPLVELGGGIYGMIAGDADKNNIINNLDFGSVANSIPMNGYQNNDLDMNGFVNVLDYSVISKNILKSSQIPK